MDHSEMKQILTKKSLKELETLYENYYGEKRKTKRTKKKQQQKSNKNKLVEELLKHPEMIYDLKNEKRTEMIKQSAIYSIPGHLLLKLIDDIAKKTGQNQDELRHMIYTGIATMPVNTMNYEEYFVTNPEEYDRVTKGGKSKKKKKKTKGRKRKGKK
tara:strand:- start:464 stop:934 length:471 start_codon:yes stop_codon:yes gene_type:complete